MEQARIEHGKYIQGQLSFAVDLNDGAKTFEAVAALSHDDKIALAKLNDIPTEPYLKVALTAILKSVVQNTWLVTKGHVPPLAAHNARLAKYKAEIAESQLASTEDLLTKKRPARAGRKILKYVIDEEKYQAEWQNWRNQSYLTIKSMIELGAKGDAGRSIAEIEDNAKETRETVRPTRNAVGQVINRLKAAGIVICINPQDAKKPRGEKKEAAPVVKKAPTPAVVVKKKH